ncbi:MAG: hypothetical protein V4664_00320 [Patescibacteria group bacterium]
MTTVINNSGEGGNGVGWVIAIVLIVAILFAFFVYGLPALRQAPADNGSGAQINVQLPGNNGGGEQTPQ